MKHQPLERLARPFVTYEKQEMPFPPMGAPPDDEECHPVILQQKPAGCAGPNCLLLNGSSGQHCSAPPVRYLQPERRSHRRAERRPNRRARNRFRGTCHGNGRGIGRRCRGRRGHSNRIDCKPSGRARLCERNTSNEQTRADSSRNCEARPILHLHLLHLLPVHDLLLMVIPACPCQSSFYLV